MTFNPVTPLIAVDAVVLHRESVLLIERKYPPLGFALPGGFVDVGERLDTAVRREVSEECSLDYLPMPVYLGYLDDPGRDPRRHVISHGFLFKFNDDGDAPIIKAADDAATAQFVPMWNIPSRTIVMGHREFIHRAWRQYTNG